MVFLTNPDNPAGNLINLEFIEKTAAKCRKENCILVIDECFIDLAENGASAVPLINKYDNLIIIKAFTKTYSLAETHTHMHTHTLGIYTNFSYDFCDYKAQ